MILEVDAMTPIPPYEQIREQVEAMIGAGRLRQGDRLPPIRQLAADLGLAPGTIARAYAELESAGLVRGHGRRGTVVTGAHSTPEAERRSRLADAARAFALRAAQLGATRQEALAAAAEALQT